MINALCIFYFNQIQPVKQNILVTFNLTWVWIFYSIKRFTINVNIDPARKKITWALRELLIVLRSVWSELSAFKRFWAVLFNCKIKYVTTKLVNQQSVGIYPQESENRRWILLKIGNLVPRALFPGFVWGGPGNLKRLGTRLEDRIKDVVLFQQENAYSGIPSRLLGD